VIIIEPELEFNEVEPAEAVVSIAGGLSLLAGSADPCEKAPPKNRNIATTAAKPINLNSPLNVPSSHPGQGASSHRFQLLSLSTTVPSSQAAPNTSPRRYCHTYDYLTTYILQYSLSYPALQLDLFSKKISKRKSTPFCLKLDDV